MADGFTIEVDRAAVLLMLDQLGESAEAHVHDAAGVTAERVQDEWRGRVRRRTGRYYEAIRIEEAGEPMHGFRVYVDKMSDPDGGTRAANFPIWQEEGTKRMHARPAMKNAVSLEQGPHLRRVSEALGDAINEVNY